MIRSGGLLGLVCFISGAAGLIFEIVWFHRCGLVFGTSVWAASLVLSSFMGGLTIGSAIVARAGNRIRGVLPAYAAAELIVAVSGVALTYLLPTLTHTIATITSRTSPTTNVVRFATAFVILLVPSTAMGATLPLLTSALARSRSGFGRALGNAYGWNTLGGVVGVLGAEVWLIGQFGVLGAAWCAALLSAGAAAIAASACFITTCGIRLQADQIRLRPAPTDHEDVLGTAPTPPMRGWPLLACSFLSGGALLALEVVWFRFLRMYLLSTTLAASLMLGVVLAGIGLGGLAASAWLKRNARAATHLPAVALAAGCAVAATYAGFRWLTDGAQIAAWPRIVWMACALTLPTSILSGVLFTLTGDAIQRAIPAETRAAGWVTLANTSGGMVGPLVAAFVILPTLGMEAAFFVLTAAYAVIAVVAAHSLGSWRTRIRSSVFVGAAMALAVALSWFPFGLMRDVYFARAAQPYTADGSKIVATREGPAETIFLMRQTWMGEPVYSRLVTDGFSMSGTAVSALRYMRYFVYWPMALHEGPIRRVLVLCYGVGVTVGAAVDIPSVESIDVAEISRDVVAVSDLIYEPAAHPFRDPRVRLHIEDGRQFLQRTADRFDLITGEPPPPRTPGAVNIYTREYFQLIRDRLAEGGMTTYWLPVGRPDPGTNVSAIVRAFCDVFDDCSLWNATPFDLMLAGGRRAAGRVSEARFVEPWTNPHVRARLSEIGFELPQQIGATFLGDSSYLRQLVAHVEPLDDNHPQRLLPVSGRPSLSDPGYGSDAAVTRLYDTVIDPARARQAFASSDFIRNLWPERVMEATIPYFDHQRILNTALWESGPPLRHIDEVHRLLTGTPLRTLPLWLLGSDAVKERIAARQDDGTGAPVYARGLSALASRDYQGAASAFAEAERRGLGDEAVRALRVYALCLANTLEDARQLANGVQPRSDDARRFWEWLGTTFQLKPL
jgi:spermidine synthase